MASAEPDHNTPLRRDPTLVRREKRFSTLAGMAIFLTPIALIALALWAVANWASDWGSEPAPEPISPQFAFSPPAGWTDATEEAWDTAPPSRTERVAGFWIVDGAERIADTESVASLTLVRALDRGLEEEASRTGEDLLELWADELEEPSTRLPEMFMTTAGYVGWFGGISGTFEGEPVTIAGIVLTDGEVTARFAAQLAPSDADQAEALRSAIDSFEFIDRPHPDT